MSQLRKTVHGRRRISALLFSLLRRLDGWLAGEPYTQSCRMSKDFVPTEDAEIIARMNSAEVEALLPTLESGMVPKMEACLRAVQGGVPRATVVDGRAPHTLLLEVFTDDWPKLGESVLFPKRLGVPDELASMVEELITNSYMNAEVVRVDGGIRMPPK